MKHIYTRFVPFIALLFLVLGCSNDVQDQENHGFVDGEGRLKARSNTSFIAETINLVSTPIHLKNNSAPWNDLVTHFQYQATVCLKDVSYTNPVIDREFKIKTPKGEYTDYSDTSGCLTFSETIPFPYLAKEEWIRHPVEIEGIGQARGLFIRELALNPWAMQVRDLESFAKSSSDTNLVSWDELNHQTSAKLDLQSIGLARINRRSTDSGDEITFQLSMGPNIQREDLGSTPVATNLVNGLFIGNFKIVENQPDHGQLLIAELKDVEIRLRQGRISQNITFNVPRGNAPDIGSELNLYVEMDAKGTIELPKLMGHTSFDLLRGTLSGQFIAMEEFDQKSFLDQFIPMRAEVVEIAEKDDGTPLLVDNRGGIMLEKIDFERGSQIEESRSTTSRINMVNFSLCLSDSLSTEGRIPINQGRYQIEVYKLNEQEEYLSDGEIRTAKAPMSNGCLEAHTIVGYDLLDPVKKQYYKVQVTAIEGEFIDTVVEREFVLIPRSETRIGYDLEFEADEIPTFDEDLKPRLYFSEATYENLGKVQDSYSINESLQVGLKSRFRFKMSPQLIRPVHDGSEPRPEALNFGTYEVKAIMLNPKTPTVSAEDFYENDYMVLTGAEKTLEVRPNGDLVISLDFPFLMSELGALAKKQLIAFEIKFQEAGDRMQPFYGVVEFFGSTPKAQFAIYEKELPELMLFQDEIIDEMLIENHRQLYAGPREEQESNLQKYRNYLREKISERIEDFDFKQLTYTEFSALEVISFNSSGHENIPSEVISERDFRNLVRDSSLKPNAYLKKFCQYFYPVPRQEPSGIGAFFSSLLGFARVDTEANSKYDECLMRPRDHISVQVTNHIEEVLTRKDITSPEGDFIENVGAVRPIADDSGEISDGTGFFVAHGNRSHTGVGSQESTTFKMGTELFLQAPPPLMLLASAGASRAYETFSQEMDAEMQMSFDRQYRQIGNYPLTFEWVKLGFVAQVRNCAAVFSTTGIKRALHICEDDLRTESLAEKWYFIGNDQRDQNGILTSDTVGSGETPNMIIRGEDKFKGVFDKLKSEDTFIVLHELNDAETPLMNTLIDLKRQGIPERAFETYQDGNFPGLMTPLIRH